MITRSGQPLWAKHCLSDERGWSWCRIKSSYPCGCLLFCGSGYRRFCNRRCQQWGLRLRLGTTIECRGCCSQKRRLNFARKRAASISKPLRPQLMVQWSVCLRGFGSIAASGHGQSAIVGFSFRLSSGPEANAAALAMCRAKGGANPRIVVAWVERGNGWRDETPGTRVGKL